jgi:DNA modification methylase
MNFTETSVEAPRWRMIHNDTTVELMDWTDNQVDMICTSIPFGTQYEYAPSLNDMGHNEDNTAFWEQMDFLIPELHRILKPGRVAAIHVKDRIRFGNMTGLGFPTVDPFSDETIAAFRKHGFHLLGRITIDTDVVRENAQTYRLTWKEMVKDSTKMGCGCCEYVIILRKAQTDPSRGYADEPVTRPDERVNSAYSLAQWQIDAAGLWRSSGDRLPSAELLKGMTLSAIRAVWRKYSADGVYDLKEHENACQALLEAGSLPTGWMLLAPIARHPMIWSDIERIRTLNSEQARRAQEQHVCLARGSLVLTLNGWIPIESVTEDDCVLTHLGNWKKVLVVKNTGVRPVIELKAHGVPNLKITPEHKLWLRKTRRKRQRDGAELAVPEWIEAGQSENGYVNLKLPPERDTDLGKYECWLLGRWLADGHVGTRGDFHVSIDPDKKEEFLYMAGEYAGPGRKLTATQYRLKGLSKTMLTCLRDCGSGAGGKQVPVDLLNLPKEKAKALLDGYLSGDGHFLPRRQRWTASSISRALLLGLAMVAQKAYQTIASVYAGRPGGGAVIEGRVVNTSQDWKFCFDLPHGHRKKQFILDDGAWKKVRPWGDAGTAETGTAETWCLKVEDDESFTAEGCIVKNCPLQLDVIERLIRRYSNPGDVVFDPFAGIGSVPYQALKMDRKGWGCELNRDYWQMAVGYCERASALDATPTLFDLAELSKKEDVA